MKHPYAHSINQDLLSLVISTLYIHFTVGLSGKMAGKSDKNSFEEPESELNDSSDGKRSSEGLNP